MENPLKAGMKLYLFNKGIDDNKTIVEQLKERRANDTHSWEIESLSRLLDVFLVDKKTSTNFHTLTRDQVLYLEDEGFNVKQEPNNGSWTVRLNI